MLGQQPGPVAVGGQDSAATAGTEFLQQLQMLGWVDRTALAVLAVFFVIGLFKGLIWQVSRVLILVAAYVVAGRFGQPLGDYLARTPAVGGNPATPAAETPETTLYLAYVLVFLGVLVVLSLLAILLQKLAAKAGLSFFDRLGGGVFGIATGSCVVLFLLFVVHMFFQGSQLAQAASGSHSLRLSQRAIDWMGDAVPDPLRQAFSLHPLHPAHAPGRSGIPPNDPVAPAPPQGGDAPAPSEPPRRQ